MKRLALFLAVIFGTAVFAEGSSDNSVEDRQPTTCSTDDDYSEMRSA